MHVLLVSAGTAGNMLPFIGLGKALKARGHDATLIGSGAGTDSARQEGLGFVELDAPEVREELSDTDPAAARKPGFLRTLGPQAVRHMRRVYQLIAERYVPGETVVVSQSWLFGARIAQEKLGVPLATVYLQPVLFGSALDTPGLPRWIPRFVPRLMNALIGRAVDWGLAQAIDSFRAELGLQPIRRPVLRWWTSPELVIGFFPEWYSPPQSDWPEQTILGGFPLYDFVGRTGDIHEQPPANGPNMSVELEEYLADGDAPLVFSQAWLIKDANDYFATSVQVARTLGRRAVLLTAHPEQLPRPLPPGIRHFGFVPLSTLLPRAAAIVHHGGMGTLAQAIAAGVPQLTVPMVLDQFDNSRRLYRLGVSQNVRLAHYRPASITRVLRQLLESPQVAERCRHYAARMREETPFEKACIALERLHACRSDKALSSAAQEA
jgi:UDP:flavonoid glycosyltransferase YjiC (YdhE family)